MSGKTWRDSTDGIRHHLEDLLEAEVPETDAYQAVQIMRKINRDLWGLINSIEGAFLDRYGSIPTLITKVAAERNVSPLAVMHDLLDGNTLHVRWDLLVRYAERFGVYPWEEAQERVEKEGANNGTDDKS